MATLPFHNVVSMDAWWDDDSSHTVNLGLAVGGTAMAKADEGMAMTIDASGPCKYRPATDLETVYGICLTVENRPTGNMGTIAFRFIQRFFLLAGDPATYGDSVVGSTGGAQGVNGVGRGGWVKKDLVNGATNPMRVVDKGTDATTGYAYVVVARI